MHVQGTTTTTTNTTTTTTTTTTTITATTTTTNPTTTTTTTTTTTATNTTTSTTNTDTKDMIYDEDLLLGMLSFVDSIAITTEGLGLVIAINPFTKILSLFDDDKHIKADVLL